MVVPSFTIKLSLTYKQPPQQHLKNTQEKLNNHIATLCYVFCVFAVICNTFSDEPDCERYRQVDTSVYRTTALSL